MYLYGSLSEPHMHVCMPKDLDYFLFCLLLHMIDVQISDGENHLRELLV